MKSGRVHLILGVFAGIWLSGCGSSETAEGAGPQVQQAARTPPEEQKKIALHFKKTLGASGDIRDGDVVRIHFNNKTITPTSLQAIHKLNRLHTLTLTACRVTDEGVAHLASLRELRVLRLDRNKAVTDTGLAHLVNLTKLETLNVANTQLTDEGLLKFDAFKNLKNLNIRYTKVTPQGLEKFEKQSSVAKNCVIESGY